MSSARHLTGAAGRWSATHPWTAILAWLGCVAALLVAGHLAGTHQLPSTQYSNGESYQAQQMLSRDFTMNASEQVLFDSSSLRVSSPAFQAAIRDLTARIQATGRVTRIRSPLDPVYANLIAPTGRAALLQFAITGDYDTAYQRVGPVVAAVQAAAAAHPQIQIAETGDATINKSANDTVMRDLRRTEALSYPITLVVLLIAFGALVAALLPLGLALMAILAATGLLAFASYAYGVTPQTSSVLIAIGLAVGVDYSMFYVKRQREERAAGRQVLDAIEVAAATSGRSVLISGLTVLLAMSGMLLAGNGVFHAMGEGAMLVVACAVIGSLTLLPALLALLGDRVDRGRLPYLSRLQRPAGQSRVWAAILDRTLARPALTVVVSVGVMVALALPLLRLHTAEPGASDLPQNTVALQTFNRVQQLFPGGGAPAVVVVEAPDVTAAAVARAGQAFERAALATGQLHQPITFEVNAAHTAAIIDVPLAGNGEDATSVRALQTLRQQVIPATLGKVPGVRVAVTGETAGTADFNTAMGQRAPWVYAYVLAFAFVLLLISFRSIVIPAMSVVLNLLSVGAAYGVVVALFQWGWGQSLFGFTSTHSIASWLPLFMFVMLFGLSMDYHVFVLSRIRESYDRTGDTHQAVTRGIEISAGVITAAAIVMVFVFLTFATMTMVQLKEMGVGLAVAVLLDATVVRAMLLPATMKLLGRYNWYLPRWLRWLPQISSSAQPPAAGQSPRRPVTVA
jgi:RND superfamily putative drug exporter